jgi:dipeptidyl aminopeptidase/acylaminoacyl peptidase
MKRLVWLLASAALLSPAPVLAQKPATTVSGVTVPASHPAPLSAYGQLPSIEEAAISPDGSTLALIVTNGEARTVVTQRLSDMKITNTLAVGTNKVRGITWAGDNNIIITRTATLAVVTGADRAEHPLTFDYNLTTHRVRQLLTDIRSDSAQSYTGATGATTRVVDGKPVLLVQGSSPEGVPAVYRIDLNTDSSSLVQAGVPTTSGLEIGPDGQVVAQTTQSVRNKDWSLRVRNPRGLWTESRRLTVEDVTDSPPSVVGMGRDGRSVLVSERQGDRDVLREVGPDGAWSDPLPTPPDSNPIHDPVSRKMIGYSVRQDDKLRTVFFDPQDQKYWNAVVASFEGDPVSLRGWSNDRKKLLVLSDSPTEGPAYFVVDLSTLHSTWIGNIYPKLKAADISPKKTISFKAADGLELMAYLTLPRGRDPHKLPLIVFPHGGPQARDYADFDWWSQAMASRGYAVLQVQFRGSDEFGRKFLEAGFGQWGRKMQTDLSDGVRYLASQGTIDPKRVCIVGASYGGYAALAGPTLDPGVYRCAVSYAGPADMGRMVEWSLGHNGLGASRYWTKFMGAETNRDQAFAAISPARFANRADAPILMIHGRDDTVVPLEQSQIMVGAMKAAGKPVDLVTLPGQDHWLSHGDTRLQMLQASMDFVEKNNPPN